MYFNCHSCLKMKTFLFTLIFSSLAVLLPAQAPTLTIFPDPVERPPYPNTALTYHIFPWSPDCHHLNTSHYAVEYGAGRHRGK